MGKDIQPGIYEQVINKNFTEKLAQIAANFKDIEPLDQAEAAGTLTAYLRHIIDQGLLIAADQADKNEKLSAKARVATIFPSVDVVCQFGRCWLRR